VSGSGTTCSSTPSRPRWSAIKATSQAVPSLGASVRRRCSEQEWRNEWVLCRHFLCFWPLCGLQDSPGSPQNCEFETCSGTRHAWRGVSRSAACQTHAPHRVSKPRAACPSGFRTGPGNSESPSRPGECVQYSRFASRDAAPPDAMVEPADPAVEREPGSERARRAPDITGPYRPISYVASEPCGGPTALDRNCRTEATDRRGVGHKALLGKLGRYDSVARIYLSNDESEGCEPKLVMEPLRSPGAQTKTGNHGGKREARRRSARCAVAAGDPRLPWLERASITARGSTAVPLGEIHPLAQPNNQCGSVQAIQGLRSCEMAPSVRDSRPLHDSRPADGVHRVPIDRSRASRRPTICRAAPGCSAAAGRRPPDTVGVRGSMRGPRSGTNRGRQIEMSHFETSHFDTPHRLGRFYGASRTRCRCRRSSVTDNEDEEDAVRYAPELAARGTCVACLSA
jgi:hypothetical protein